MRQMLLSEPNVDQVFIDAKIGEEYEHIGNVIIKTYDVAAKHDNYNPKNEMCIRDSFENIRKFQ